MDSPEKAADVLMIGDMRVDLTGSSSAPVVYFELAPTFGHLPGMIEVALSTTKLVPGPNNKPERVAFISGLLKCNYVAAVALRDSLTNALLLAGVEKPPEGSKN